MAKVLLVIAPENFREEEYFEPKSILENAGMEVVTASLKSGEIYGVNGKKAIADKVVSEINPSDFAAIIFVGGPGMAEITDNAQLISLAKKFYQTDKIVAAICVAPEILANAGILNGISATSWQGSRQKLLAQGVTVVSKPVVWSGKIITAQGPASAREFGETIVTA